MSFLQTVALNSREFCSGPLVQGPWFIHAKTSRLLASCCFSFLLCGLFLFQAFSSKPWIFNVVTFSSPICCLVLMCYIATFLLVNLIKICCHSTSTFCTQFQLSALFEVCRCVLNIWTCWNFYMHILLVGKETSNCLFKTKLMQIVSPDHVYCR